jgi:hypothetical protein
MNTVNLHSCPAEFEALKAAAGGFCGEASSRSARRVQESGRAQCRPAPCFPRTGIIPIRCAFFVFCSAVTVIPLCRQFVPGWDHCIYCALYFTLLSFCFLIFATSFSLSRSRTAVDAGSCSTSSLHHLHKKTNHTVISLPLFFGHHSDVHATEQKREQYLECGAKLKRKRTE